MIGDVTEVETTGFPPGVVLHLESLSLVIVIGGASEPAAEAGRRADLNGTRSRDRSAGASPSLAVSTT